MKIFVMNMNTCYFAIVMMNLVMLASSNASSFLEKWKLKDQSTAIVTGGEDFNRSAIFIYKFCWM